MNNSFLANPPTDDDREAEIRRYREAQMTPLQHNPCDGGGFYGWSAAEIDCLLRRLDEAKAEITRLRKQLYDDNAAMRLIHEAAELLRAPVGADVMEIAETLLPRAPLGLFKSGREEAIEIVARALQAYGDARARERGDPDEIARLIKLNEQLGKVNAGLRQKLTDLKFPPDETERAPPEETANP